MARLQRGENPKIDHINDLVAIAKDDNSSQECRTDAIEELLSMFKPMLIKICDKWAKQFNDSSHKIIQFNELLSDAQYWFIKYTNDKYIIDGDATYNKFIHDHIDQRIRYIYECQIKYYNETIFPDPDKNQDTDDVDQLELVAYNYSQDISGKPSLEDEVIDEIYSDSRIKLANKILDIINNSNKLNSREKKLLIETMYNGKTQDKMSQEFDISRTRIVQILKKAKQKLKSELLNNAEFWDLINDTDIDFDNNLL